MSEIVRSPQPSDGAAGAVPPLSHTSSRPIVSTEQLYMYLRFVQLMGLP
jgi:hypothetical protein